jgi:peptidoglycan-associated lipoprotein
MESIRYLRSARVGALALAALAFAGCHRVKHEELDAAIADLRSQMQTEMQQGDQKVSTDLNSRMDGLEQRLTALAGQLNQLSDSFTVTVTRMDNALRFDAPVFFEFADAAVRPGDQAVLDRFAGVIKDAYPDVLITAEGFTDRAGSTTYNKKLGLKRAEAVIDYLSTQGLDKAQLRAVSYGEDKNRLLDAEWGPGEQGLRNRRVVLVIEGKDLGTTTTTTTMRGTTDGE